jgi:hypothetical protein
MMNALQLHLSILLLVLGIILSISPASSYIMPVVGQHSFSPSRHYNSLSSSPRAQAIKSRQSQSQSQSLLFVSNIDEENNGSIVLIKEETIEFTAGLIGGIVGCALGGPILGTALGAATGNSLSKSSAEAGDVVKKVSQSSIELYNYLSKLEGKYGAIDRAREAIVESYERLKAEDNIPFIEPDELANIEDIFSTASIKLEEINAEYDLRGGSMQVLGALGELTEKAVKMGVDLSDEYELSRKIKEVFNDMVDAATGER